jgi:hypothetical protein
MIYFHTRIAPLQYNGSPGSDSRAATSTPTPTPSAPGPITWPCFFSVVRFRNGMTESRTQTLTYRRKSSVFEERCIQGSVLTRICQLISLNWSVHKKPIHAILVKKFCEFLGSCKSSTVFTCSRHWPLSSASWIQSTPSFLQDQL